MYLADTGSNKTIINKNVNNIKDNTYGPIRQFKQSVLTAEEHRAHIIGIKKCKIRIGNWLFVTELLISNNLIQKCIIGMDILSICPPTKDVIKEFKRKISECTNQLKQSRFSKEKNANKTIKFEQKVNNVNVYQLERIDRKQRKNQLQLNTAKINKNDSDLYTNCWTQLT